MADDTTRTVDALLDVVAVEDMGPGLVRVVTFSDAYHVDVRERRCTCPDHQYREAQCKHLRRADIETGETPVPVIDGVVDDLDQGPEPLPDFEDFQPGVEYV
ncbi:MAG: SWIM zinc finger family protein [Halovenus sp.]